MAKNQCGDATWQKLPRKSCKAPRPPGPNLIRGSESTSENALPLFFPADISSLSLSLQFSRENLIPAMENYSWSVDEFLDQCRLSGDSAYTALRLLLEKLEDPTTRAPARVFLSDLQKRFASGKASEQCLSTFHFRIQDVLLDQYEGRFLNSLSPSFGSRENSGFFFSCYSHSEIVRLRFDFSFPSVSRWPNSEIWLDCLFFVYWLKFLSEVYNILEISEVM